MLLFGRNCSFTPSLNDQDDDGLKKYHCWSRNQVLIPHTRERTISWGSFKSPHHGVRGKKHLSRPRRSQGPCTSLASRQDSITRGAYFFCNNNGNNHHQLNTHTTTLQGRVSAQGADTKTNKRTLTVHTTDPSNTNVLSSPETGWCVSDK